MQAPAHDEDTMETEVVIEDLILWVKHYVDPANHFNYCLHTNVNTTLPQIQQFIQSKTKIPVERQLLHIVHKNKEECEPMYLDVTRVSHQDSIMKISDFFENCLSVQDAAHIRHPDDTPFVIQAYSNQDHAITLLSQKWNL